MLKLFSGRITSSRALSVARKAACFAETPFDIKDFHVDSSLRGESRVRDLLDQSAVGLDLNPSSNDDQWFTSPYVQGTFLQTSQRIETAVERVKMDPSDTTIILFPGYGSQFVGMARSLVDVPPARDIFDCASEVVG